MEDVVAASIAVRAMAVAPSNRAFSAEGPTHAAVNSGWWFTAPLESMPMSGWIDGIAKEMFAISVE